MEPAGGSSATLFFYIHSAFCGPLTLKSLSVKRLRFAVCLSFAIQSWSPPNCTADLSFSCSFWQMFNTWQQFIDFLNFIQLFLGLEDLHWSVQSVWQTHERHPGRLWGVQVRFDNWWPMTGTPVCLYSNDDQLWMLHGRCGGSRFYLLCRIRIRSE